MEVKKAYIVHGVYGVECICEDAADARKEAKELDCKVKVCDWRDQDDVADKINEKV